MKYRYTIDQVYLFFEKCSKSDLDKRKEDAIVMANAIVYGSPSYSRKDARSKQQMWNKFMRSLSWDKIQGKGKKKKFGDFKRMFGSAFIPIKEKMK